MMFLPVRIDQIREAGTHENITLASPPGHRLVSRGCHRVATGFTGCTKPKQRILLCLKFRQPNQPEAKRCA